MDNNKRFDLSDRLIHFFRKVTLGNGDNFTVPETWGPGDIVEDPDISPMFLLRNSVRIGRIWATWSMRNGRRTVYGPHPAVCFTEMPLGAFVEAGIKRERLGQAMSPYGLVFPKAALFNRGARPVIYGLSSTPSIPRGTDGGERVIPSKSLPLDEQYRYVAYAPGKIDWTHEREWRWKCTEHMTERELGLPPDHGSEIPGLDLNGPDLAGLGAVVKTDVQAERLIHDVLTVTDKLRRRKCNYEFVISLERLRGVRNLHDPKEVEAAIHAAAFDLAPYFQQSKEERRTLITNFMDAATEVTTVPLPSTPPNDEWGGCWLWLTDARHAMVRALIQEGRMVVINSDGRYLVDIRQFDPSNSLRDLENRTRRLAELLFERHGLPATYHSVLGKFGPDDVPSYANPPLENRFHFNHGNDKEDF
jgi:hypothetical protein